MPTQVFERLEQNKKDRIIKAACDEFSVSTFEKATITSICKKADIPRITFYTYFESLEDIFSYLLQIFKDNCYQGQAFENDALIHFFLGLIGSEKGIKEVYKALNTCDYEKKITNHIIISICLQYKCKVITYEEMKSEINLLT